MTNLQRLKPITADEAKVLYSKEIEFYIIADSKWRRFLNTHYVKWVNTFPKYITFNRLMKRLAKADTLMDVEFYTVIK